MLPAAGSNLIGAAGTWWPGCWTSPGARRCQSGDGVIRSTPDNLQNGQWFCDVCRLPETWDSQLHLHLVHHQGCQVHVPPQNLLLSARSFSSGPRWSGFSPSTIHLRKFIWNQKIYKNLCASNWQWSSRARVTSRNSAWLQGFLPNTDGWPVFKPHATSDYQRTTSVLPVLLQRLHPPHAPEDHINRNQHLSTIKAKTVMLNIIFLMSTGVIATEVCIFAPVSALFRQSNSTLRWVRE